MADALKPGVEIESLTARTVQGYFTAWLCEAAGGSLNVTETTDNVSITAEVPVS